MLTDLPIYKHPIRPGTDERLIQAWKRRHKMIECGPYQCTMTVKACKARHKRAMKAKKTTCMACVEISLPTTSTNSMF